MFTSSPALPFVRFLEEHAAEIRAEAVGLDLAEYADWPLEEAYQGGWKIFCLLSRDAGWVLAGTCAANARRCPRTHALLARVPGAMRGGFSLLLPGTHVFAHTDAPEDSLRCHLGLVTNPRAAIRFGADVLAWQPGRCLLFDGASPHEAVNLGDEPRVVCLLDIERSALASEVLP